MIRTHCPEKFTTRQVQHEQQGIVSTGPAPPKVGAHDFDEKGSPPDGMGVGMG